MFPVSHFSQVLNGESAFGSTENLQIFRLFSQISALRECSEKTYKVLFLKENKYSVLVSSATNKVISKMVNNVTDKPYLR